MFETSEQKGLFTFYWEQNHKNVSKREQMKEQSKTVQVKRENQHLQKKMEGQFRKNNNKKYTSNTILNNKPDLFQLILPHKQKILNKKGHIVDELKRKHSEQVMNHYRTKLNRSYNHSEHMLQNNHNSAKHQSQTQSKHTNNIFLDIQYHYQLIEFKQKDQKNPSYSNSIKPTAIKKMNAYSNQKKMSELAQNKDIQTMEKKIGVQLPEDRFNKEKYKLPGLKNISKGKMNKMTKENCFIESLVMERQESNEQVGSSVINLGTLSQQDQQDEYKNRWKKRKQQFLKLLSVSLTQRKQI